MRLAILTLLCVFTSVHCHLILTFPPARKYQLDFLDNVRTNPPCGGMVYNDGDPITTIETGSPITATWHGAYPHMGGIRFELLNTTGSVIAELTGEGYKYTNDSTRLSHNLTFTEDHLCDHCILRITRQAGEWTAAGDDGYLFWSCADVKIMVSSDTCYEKQCLNNGTCSSGACTCPRTYLGDRCQYKNDCEDATDCNSNGMCVDLQSTYYPTKVCYCNSGKMGRYCSKDSPVSNAVMSIEDLANHYHSELFANPKFDLYWRLIGTNNDEIEFVLQVETNTWAALGFRPNNVISSCKDFPTNTGNGGPEPEPEAEVTPEPTAEQATTPAPEPEPEPTTPAPSGSRKRRAAEIEEMMLLSRERRQATETNVIKELCLAGNISGAEAWATQNYNAVPSAPQPEGEGTPAPEGEGTPIPEGERTPAPKGEAISTPEGEAHSTPEGEAISTPEGEVISTPEGEISLTPEGETIPAPETGGGNLHPMDCQDMILVSAEGNRHRILDSYTRDRSTPRADSFYGGTDDLTAAVAARVDGKLHAVIRRKLATSDQADHTLTDSTALFVWARGQDPARFYHWPFTGLERCQASNYDYYKINELKYHGTKNTQRGTRSINVFQNPDILTSTASTGSHSSPSGCTDSACNYVATWTYDKAEKVITFSISAKVALKKWAAIGFSKDQNMVDSDAIVVWMDDANSPTVTDRYISAKTAEGVALDSNSNVKVIAGTHSNGVMTVQFSRSLDTGDTGSDIALNECRYFLYAWGGDATSTGLGYHSTRESSTSKICIDSGSARVVLSAILNWSWMLCTFLIYRLTQQ